MKGLIFTYVLTYGGALASLFNPFVGFLIYICFSIIKPESMWSWSVQHGNYSRFVAIALLAGWALKGFGDWRFGPARGTVIALIGYWAWSIAISPFAAEQSRAWGFVEALSKIVLPFLVGITTVDSIKKLKQLAWVIVLSQGYAALEFNLCYYSGYNRLREVKESKDAICSSVLRAPRFGTLPSGSQHADPGAEQAARSREVSADALALRHEALGSAKIVVAGRLSGRPAALQ